MSSDGQSPRSRSPKGEKANGNLPNGSPPGDKAAGEKPNEHSALCDQIWDAIGPQMDTKHSNFKEDVKTHVNSLVGKQLERLEKD